MITHIRMKNFKSWKDSGEVKLAPLTGFFGTNSSGKSSLLQMLLLLKQTIGTDEILFFGDENSLVNLGSFHEVIHGHTLEEVLGLEFGWKIGNPFTIEARLGDGLEYDPEKTSFTTDSFTFNASIMWKNDELVVEDNPYRVKCGSKQQVINEGRYSEKIYGEPFGLELQEPPPITLISSEFKKLFNHIYPLGPTRVHPQRHYHWEGTNPDSVGQSGEYMIDSMLNARVDQQTTPYKGQKVPIEERISWWLREMDLAYSFSIKRTSTGTDRDYDVLIQKAPDSTKVTLADMGYGLSQFLPVLVHCYYAPEGSTLILEQPGIHLHPKVQSQLADLLIEVITERKLQILVESHSEHLLNRLQRRVAEEKIAADQTALYFCRYIDGASKIDKLDMDEFGNITNWPENFFGDEMGDLFAMTEAQRERQKRATGLIEGTTIAPSK